MKLGSVLVRSGDRVKQGQKVGAIGFAGDSIFPHLHYSLMSGPTLFKDWGLPIYFLHFRRVMGATSIQVQRGSVDSGDFLDSYATYLP
jgi:murein DD-endopeptidase MepM/ murein hydrolase activator NlpD